MTPQTADQDETGAAGLTQSDWLGRLSTIGRHHGFFERLGTEHLALFVQESATLVVSFDRASRVYAEAKDGLPPGFEAVQQRKWSLLSILSLGDSWYRSPDLMAFFDQLKVEGFFESFNQVIFVGFGPACGHAACVYSSAAPGAFVLASAPAATLDPERAGFERRFRSDRRGDFSRYGDAPRLIETARNAVILYDPTDAASAAHAGQFHSDNVTLAPLRFTGAAPHRLIMASTLMVPFLRKMAKMRLTRAQVARYLRPVRRADSAYLWRLAQIAQSHGQFDRARKIADYAADVTGEDRFTDLSAQLDPGKPS